jgi:hypothetical protein
MSRIELSKPQHVLEHAAAHILFDQQLDSASEPCGLCLRPSPLCKFYLKTGKGFDANLQINYSKSICANMLRLSYAVASLSTISSPCSNIPVQCPWCPQSAPAIWRYNMFYHIKNNHMQVSLNENKDIWNIGNSERDGLKKVWEKRNKVTKNRKSKKWSGANLVISTAHASHQVLRYSSCDIIMDMWLTPQTFSSSIASPDVKTQKEDEPKSDTDQSDSASPKARKTHSRLVSSDDEGEQPHGSPVTSPAVPNARRKRSRVLLSSDEEDKPDERDGEQLDVQMEPMDDRDSETEQVHQEKPPQVIRANLRNYQ